MYFSFKYNLFLYSSLDIFFGQRQQTDWHVPSRQPVKGVVRREEFSNWKKRRVYYSLLYFNSIYYVFQFQLKYIFFGHHLTFFYFSLIPCILYFSFKYNLFFYSALDIFFWSKTTD